MASERGAVFKRRFIIILIAMVGAFAISGYPTQIYNAWGILPLVLIVLAIVVIPSAVFLLVPRLLLPPEKPYPGFTYRFLTFMFALLVGTVVGVAVEPEVGVEGGAVVIFVVGVTLLIFFQLVKVNVKF